MRVEAFFVARDVRIAANRRAFQIDQPGIAAATFELGAEDPRFFVFGLVKIDPDSESWPKMFLVRMRLEGTNEILAEIRHKPSRGLRVSPIIATFPFCPSLISEFARKEDRDETVVRYRLELVVEEPEEALATTSLEVTIQRAED